MDSPGRIIEMYESKHVSDAFVDDLLRNQDETSKTLQPLQSWHHEHAPQLPADLIGSLYLCISGRCMYERKEEHLIH